MHCQNYSRIGLTLFSTLWRKGQMQQMLWDFLLDLFLLGLYSKKRVL